MKKFLTIALVFGLAACGTAAATSPSAHAERDAAIHESAGQGAEVELSTTTTTMPTTTTTQATTTTTAPTTTTTQTPTTTDGRIDGTLLPGSGLNETEWMAVAIMQLEPDAAIFCEGFDTLYIDEMAQTLIDGFNSDDSYPATMTELDGVVTVTYAMQIHCPELMEDVIYEVFDRYPASFTNDYQTLVSLLADMDGI